MADINDNRYGPHQIVQDSEGNYRWIYAVNSKSNPSFLRLYLLIFALIILIPGSILFFMIYGENIAHGYWTGTGSYLAVLAAIFLGVELLTFLIYKLIERIQGGTTEIPYLMGEDFIIVHPGNKWTPNSYLQTFFADVKNIQVDRESDLILLKEPLRVTHVYVPKEDLTFVLNFIRERVPQTKKITER